MRHKLHQGKKSVLKSDTAQAATSILCQNKNTHHLSHLQQEQHHLICSYLSFHKN